MTKKVEARARTKQTRRGRSCSRKAAAEIVKEYEGFTERGKTDETARRAKNAPSEEYLEAWKRGWKQAEDAIYVARLERVDEGVDDDRVRGLVDGRAAYYDMALEYVGRYGATRYAEVAEG